MDHDSVRDSCFVNGAETETTAVLEMRRFFVTAQATDIRSGVRVQLLVCRVCSRRWYSGDTPRLAIAA